MSALDDVNVKRLLDNIRKAIDNEVSYHLTVEQGETFVNNLLWNYLDRGIISGYHFNYNSLTNQFEVEITPVKPVQEIKVYVDNSQREPWFAPAGLNRGVDDHLVGYKAKEIAAPDTGYFYAPYVPVLMPIIRKVVPALIAQEIIGVQPMSDVVPMPWFTATGFDWASLKPQYPEMPDGLFNSLQF
jgi:hypothetical protein